MVPRHRQKRASPTVLLEIEGRHLGEVRSHLKQTNNYLSMLIETKLEKVILSDFRISKFWLVAEQFLSLSTSSEAMAEKILKTWHPWNTFVITEVQEISLSTAQVDHRGTGGITSSARKPLLL